MQPVGIQGSGLRLGLSVATAAFRLHCRTLRSKVLLGDGSIVKPFRHRFSNEIFALCEADALALGGFIAGAGFTVLVTVGKDGDRATFVLKKLGGTVVRGSSRLGGADALRRLVRRLESSSAPAAIVVDGYVWLDDKDRKGLGHHLYDALQQSVAVIGVAKTEFAGATQAVEIRRGSSARPLFVTAVGLESDVAADCIRRMHGNSRIPTLLKRVDTLSRLAKTNDKE